MNETPQAPEPLSESLPEPLPAPLSAEGAALLAEGRARAAVDVLRRAVAAGELAAPDLLTRAYFDSGSWRAATEWLSPLVQQGHVRFAGRLGAALLELGDLEAAEGALRLAVGSGDVAAANDLAILLRDEGRLVEAVQVLVHAAEEGDQQAPANLVELHLEAGDVHTAVTAAEHYAAETRPDTIVALADARVQQGRTDEAERLYRRGTELGGLRAHTAYALFLLSVRGDAAAAEYELREAGACDEPGWAGALGRFLLDDDRPAEARGYLQTAADSGDRSARAVLAELDGDDAVGD